MQDAAVETTERATLSIPSYDWIVDTFDVHILKRAGDLAIKNGDLALTKDGDIKIGNTAYSALFRLVQAWRFHWPHLANLFGLAENMKAEAQRTAAAIDEIAPSFAANIGSSSNLQSARALGDYFERQDAALIGREIYSSCIILLADTTIRRFKDDIEPKESDWINSSPSYGGVSFGRLVVASANSFRHADEWAKTRVPTSRQRQSQQTIGQALQPHLPTESPRAPNCSGVLEILSDGWQFERLTTHLLAFANDVASRSHPDLASR